MMSIGERLNYNIIEKHNEEVLNNDGVVNDYITLHTVKRYCERVLNIPKNESENYAKQYELSLGKEISELKNNSIYFWTGVIGNNPEREFYLNIENNIIFVVKCRAKDTIITLYNIDFDMPNHIEKTIVKQLLKEINKLKKKHLTAQKRLNTIIKRKVLTLKNCQDEITLIQEQLNSLLLKKGNLEKEIKHIEEEPERINKEIDKHAKKIANPHNYLRDMQLIS